MGIEGTFFVWSLGRGDTVDFLYHMRYYVTNEAEESIQVQNLSYPRAKAYPCSYVWVCAFRLQLGLASQNRCVL